MPKLNSLTDRKFLDLLIDHYENYRPTAGRRILIEVSAKRLAKILDQDVQYADGLPVREFKYRGRVIVAYAGIVEAGVHPGAP